LDYAFEIDKIICFYYFANNPGFLSWSVSLFSYFLCKN